MKLHVIKPKFRTQRRGDHHRRLLESNLRTRGVASFFPTPQLPRGGPSRVTGGYGKGGGEGIGRPPDLGVRSHESVRIRLRSAGASTIAGVAPSAKSRHPSSMLAVSGHPTGNLGRPRWPGNDYRCTRRVGIHSLPGCVARLSLRRGRPRVASRKDAEVSRFFCVRPAATLSLVARSDTLRREPAPYWSAPGAITSGASAVER